MTSSTQAPRPAAAGGSGPGLVPGPSPGLRPASSQGLRPCPGPSPAPDPDPILSPCLRGRLDLRSGPGLTEDLMTLVVLLVKPQSQMLLRAACV